MPESTAVSDLLRQAARLGVTVWPDWLPESAAHLYQAICDGLAPALHLGDAQRCRIALDTTAHLCAELSGTRLTPQTTHHALPPIRHCFDAHAVPQRCLYRAINELATTCRGGPSWCRRCAAWQTDCATNACGATTTAATTTPSWRGATGCRCGRRGGCWGWETGRGAAVLLY